MQIRLLEKAAHIGTRKLRHRGGNVFLDLGFPPGEAKRLLAHGQVRRRLIRLSFIGSQFRSTLRSHARSPSRSCVSRRSLWS
jgi:hypothetical protein